MGLENITIPSILIPDDISPVVGVKPIVFPPIFLGSLFHSRVSQGTKVKVRRSPLSHWSELLKHQVKTSNSFQRFPLNIEMIP